jgi:hypothetical protein
MPHIHTFIVHADGGCSPYMPCTKSSAVDRTMLSHSYCAVVPQCCTMSCRDPRQSIGLWGPSLFHGTPGGGGLGVVARCDSQHTQPGDITTRLLASAAYSIRVMCSHTRIKFDQFRPVSELPRHGEAPSHIEICVCFAPAES